ncbi:MAG: tetratricopeptide repeat protein [Myxococcales bacterium]|nr:tetratricopeptide repeat protein [Myxococcales bacterium]
MTLNIEDSMRLMSEGHTDEAIAIASRFESHPTHGPDALHILGVAAAQNGQTEQALDFMYRAVAADPNNIERRLNYGTVALEVGATDTAIRELEQVIPFRTQDPEVITIWGNALQHAGRFEEAITAHEQAINMLPTHPVLWSNLACTYLAWGRLEAAAAGYEYALKLDPNVAELHYRLGATRVLQGSPAAACTAYRKTLDLDPNHARARTSLGVVLRSLGNLDEGFQEQERAYQTAPEDIDVRWNLAVSSLFHGRWTSGWALYEARREREPQLGREGFGIPWTGDIDMDATLVVEREQGYGDIFMFSRFIERAAQRVKKLVFRCPPRLCPLMQQGLRTPENVTIEPFELVPHAGLYAPIMSLPHLLDLGDTLLSQPYLQAPWDRVQMWGHRLGPKTRALRIGLAWQGNPDFPRDQLRSIPLADLHPILSLENVEVVNLQLVDGLEQLADCPAHLCPRQLGPDVDTDGAFLDTAAIIHHLDLVVSVDSAIAHLAGAMGIPTLLLLHEVPDWRWGQGSEIWYKSLKSFRQREPGQWASAVQAATTHIQNLLTPSRPNQPCASTRL